MARKRKKKQTGLSLGAILMVAAILLACAGLWKIMAGSQTAIDTGRIIPESADLTFVKTAEGVPEQRIAYTGFDVSFNPRMHQPNWVAWELTGRETEGREARENKFYNDPDVDGCAETWDYNYSGYDRGHMAPAGDMKWSKEAMHCSFSMANICPQAKSLNTGTWKRIEEKCRVWAKADSAIVIVCGPVLNDPIRDFIGDSRVAVPKRFFKVVLSPYSDPVRGIGFVMDNDRVEGGMQKAAVSINEVERITGHDFFSELPDSIENIVEQQCDYHYWSTLRPKKAKRH